MTIRIGIASLERNMIIENVSLVRILCRVVMSGDVFRSDVNLDRFR